MKTYDWTKAQAVVDAYLHALESKHPLQLGRSWIEVTMAKVGLVDDWRFSEFGESHAAWYACLIRTKSITRVTQRETELQSNPSGTAKSIQKLRLGRLRGSPTAMFLAKMLEQPRSVATAKLNVMDRTT